jgi:hypothetical protein
MITIDYKLFELYETIKWYQELRDARNYLDHKLWGPKPCGYTQRIKQHIAIQHQCISNTMESLKSEILEWDI